MARTATASGPTATYELGTNEVTLVGRLAGAATEITLPSGDLLSNFRVVVPRREGTPRRGAKVDTIDCVATTAPIRRFVGRRAAGDALMVVGSLHRRFFRSAGAVASRYEVRATRVTRVTLDDSE